MDTNVKKPRIKSREYPALTLNEAIDFIGKFKGFPMNKPISYDVAAKTVGVSQTTKSFRYSISSAKQYGLISTSSGDQISFLEPAKDLMYPTGDDRVNKELKIQCFRSPKLYDELIQVYENQSLPPLKTLENVLIAQYGISPTTAQKAAQTFLDTVEEVGVAPYGVLNLDIENNHEEDSIVKNDMNNESTTASQSQSNFVKGINEDNTNDVSNSYKFEIPTLSGKSAIIQIPNDISAKDLDYIKLYIENMLPLFMENLKTSLEE